MWSELTQMPRLTSVSSEFLWHDDPQQAVSSHAGGDDFDNHEKGESQSACAVGKGNDLQSDLGRFALSTTATTIG